MPEQHKIKSVLELARFRVGQCGWWVILRPCQEIPELTTDQQWMLRHHPKALYRGPYRHLWPARTQLPRLQHQDFAQVLNLLTSRFHVEQFPVCDLTRSRDTGEFFYANEYDEWIPESALYDTKVAADRELTRVLRLFHRWVDDHAAR